jgi:hypothetical protein
MRPARPSSPSAAPSPDRHATGRADATPRPSEDPFTSRCLDLATARNRPRQVRRIASTATRRSRRAANARGPCASRIVVGVGRTEPVSRCERFRLSGNAREASGSASCTLVRLIWGVQSIAPENKVCYNNMFYIKTSALRGKSIYRRSSVVLLPAFEEQSQWTYIENCKCT